MSVRRPDNPMNRVIRAYLYRNDNQPRVFYCREQVIKNITNPLGDMMSDGERYLVTTSDIDFKPNDFVKVATEQQMLTIESVTYEIDHNDNNSLRGKPRYEKTLHVK